MPTIQCPECSTVIEAPSEGTARCPSCGFIGPAPRAPTSSEGWTARPFTAPPGQVPQTRVMGRPRKFWASFFLGLVTIGIYYLVWNYKTFRELDQQHGQSHEGLWYWLGIVFIFVPVPLVNTIFYLIYAGKEIQKLERYRAQRGLASGISPGLFVALYLLGIVTLGITTIVGYHKLTTSQNEVWADVYRRAGQPWPFNA